MRPIRIRKWRDVGKTESLLSISTGRVGSWRGVISTQHLIQMATM